MMRGMSESRPLGVDAQMVWLGQPAQASPWPASLDSGPGQCSGSGAMRERWFFRGAERSTWMGFSSAVILVVVVGDIIRGIYERGFGGTTLFCRDAWQFICLKDFDRACQGL